MDLALSLGEKPKAPLTFLDQIQPQKTVRVEKVSLGFCMGLGEPHISNGRRSKTEVGEEEEEEEKSGSSDPPVQLDLLPVTPVQRNIQFQPPSHMIPFPWLTANLLGEPGPSHKAAGREVEVNRGRSSLAAEEGEDGGVQHSSPNSTVSSLIQNMDHRRGYNCKRESEMTSLLVVLNNHDQAGETGQRGHVSYSNSRARSTDDQDDEEEIINGLNRKKLRLSKEQSAFLEDSFKEHKTLNPKQKLALAKQLNLRPRQVEVWFQNRRARTKLKQTEVDCEYLKKWCETLTEENRRLQKEVQELRALKTSQPFYMQLPATTLTMCPSCEHVASTATANATTTYTTTTTSVDAGTGTKSRSYTFTTSQTEAQAQTQIQQARSLD